MSKSNLNRFDQFVNEVTGDIGRSVIGFDRVFDGFRTAIGSYDAYPPYNVEKLSTDEYRISLALAGFKKENINLASHENWLLITGDVSVPSENDPVTTFLHRGIALRSFERKVQLADDIEVIEASMKDGLLTINLARIVPEKKKANTIKIK